MAAVPIPAPLRFFVLEWDAPDPAEGVTGYRIYLGRAPGVYYPPLDLNWRYALHETPMVPVLFQPPVVYFRLSAFGDKGESVPTPEGHWPPDGTPNWPVQ